MLKRLAILVGTLIAPFMVHAELVPTPVWSGTTGGGFTSGMDFLALPIQFGGVNAPKFNGSTGDLKKATFTFTVSVSGAIAGTGLDNEDVTGTVRTVFSVDAGGTPLLPLVPLLPFELDMPFSMFIPEGETGFDSFFGRATFSRTLELPGDSAALAMLTHPVGGGTFALNCSTFTDVISDSPSGGSYDPLIDTGGTCAASLVYTFEDGNNPDPDPNGVPEPGTLALVGLAMAGAALAARRRRTV